MRKQTTTTIATYGVLALAGAAPVVLPEQLPMAGASAAISMPEPAMGPPVREACEWPAHDCSSSTNHKAATETSLLDPATTQTVH